MPCESAPRALLLGGDFRRGGAGGLSIVTEELRAALERRGWVVECPALERDESGDPHAIASVLASVRSHTLVHAHSRFPVRVRRWAVNLLRSRQSLERTTALLAAAEATLKKSRFDVVLVFVDPHQVPGLLSLMTNLHPIVASVSLNALADELRYTWLWKTTRAIARRRLNGSAHPHLAKRVDPARLRHAVFASSAWRQDALRQGLPPDRTSTIYFGVEAQPDAARGPWNARLLWVGRLAPEKGLHRLLEAFPALRARMSDVTLTAIAAGGPPSYRRLIEQLLPAGVSLIGPRPRAALQHAYREHDALVFYSVFEEPVALVVLEAFAAGLPVLATRPHGTQGPLRDEDTCLCFDEGDVDSLAQATERLRRDPSLRRRLAANAREVVRREYSLEAMGEAYDRLLRSLTQSPG